MDFIEKLLGRDYKYYADRAAQYSEKKEWGNARLEAMKSVELMPENAEEASEINNKLAEYEKALIEYHMEQAGICRENGGVEEEITSLENALELLPDDRKNELAEPLRDAHERLKAMNIDDLAMPHLERGESFLKKDMPGEALVEFREALRLYGDIDDELKGKLESKVVEVENILVEPYLVKAEALIKAGDEREARGELERARSLAVDCGKELNKKIDKLLKEVGVKKSKADETEFVPRATWDAAIEDYMQAVEAYFSFSQNDGNPYIPAHRNSAEKTYRNARLRLGNLYIQRADGYFGENKFKIALKEYQEALKFFTKEDVSERTHVHDRLKLIRAQRQK